MKTPRITIEPSPELPEVLDVRDAMNQVLDFFEILTDPGNSNIVWNLTFATTNSPFTVEGSPIDLRTEASAYSSVEPYVARIQRGFSRMKAGEPLNDDFPADKKGSAIKMMKRNLNGIGTTKITFFDQGSLVVFDRMVAERAIDVIQDDEDDLYDYLFSTFAHKEVGSLEGTITGVGTDYEEAALQLKDSRTRRDIWCRIDDEVRKGIEKRLTARDVWQHRRVRIRGNINYDPKGKIVRLYDGSLTFIDANEVGVEDIRDPDFTSGLAPYEYIDRLRENEFD